MDGYPGHVAFILDKGSHKWLGVHTHCKGWRPNILGQASPLLGGVEGFASSLSDSSLLSRSPPDTRISLFD